MLSWRWSRKLLDHESIDASLTWESGLEEHIGSHMAIFGFVMRAHVLHASRLLSGCDIYGGRPRAAQKGRSE